MYSYSVFGSRGGHWWCVHFGFSDEVQIRTIKPLPYTLSLTPFLSYTLHYLEHSRYQPHANGESKDKIRRAHTFNATVNEALPSKLFPKPHLVTAKNRGLIHIFDLNTSAFTTTGCDTASFDTNVQNPSWDWGPRNRRAWGCIQRKQPDANG